MGQSRIRRGRAVTEQKQEEALERQKAREARTDEEQLERLDRANLRAKSERERLNERIADREEKLRRRRGR